MTNNRVTPTLASTNTKLVLQTGSSMKSRTFWAECYLLWATFGTCSTGRSATTVRRGKNRCCLPAVTISFINAWGGVAFFLMTGLSALGYRLLQGGQRIKMSDRCCRADLTICRGWNSRYAFCHNVKCFTV